MDPKRKFLRKVVTSRKSPHHHVQLSKTSNGEENIKLGAKLRAYKVFDTYIPVNRKNDPNETQEGTVNLAVSFCVPLPNTTGVETLPVILESLPYRKNDSMYPLRPNQWDYFTSRGFIYAQVDLRGTGSSDGVRLAYEYSKTELLDLCDVIRYLSDPNSNTWFDGKVVTNQCVGMWGQSWSAFNSLILAGWKYDPTVPQDIKNKLAGLKTIIPMHGAINLYEGDIHYMDGCMHFDEYILSVDHENAIPSPGDMTEHGGYLIDQNFINTRWTQTPWTFFYLNKMLKYPKDDPLFWTEPLKVINGPFTPAYPFSYKMPTFVIGSLLDGYRDAAVQLYQILKNNNVCVKFAMSSGDHSIPDETSIPGLWEWREPAIEWFNYWLNPTVNVPTNGVLPSQVSKNEFALFVRDGIKSSQYSGTWRNESWPIPANRKYAPLSKLYLNSNFNLTPNYNTTNETWVGLDYKSNIGTETNVWWGDLTNDMSNLDNQSLTFTTSALSDNVELIGFPELNLIAQIKNKDSNKYDNSLNAQFHVRIEDVGSDGTSVLVTGASINTAYPNQDAPATLTDGVYVKDSKQFPLKIRIHFTTWTFLKGRKIRVSISNALFRMMWPTKFNMEGKLLTDNINSYINLPLYVIPSDANSSTPPYMNKTVIPYVYAPDTFYFYNGGYPSIYQNPVPATDLAAAELAAGVSQVYWYSDYYSLCRGWQISTLISHRDTTDSNNPENASWVGYALQRYQYLGVSDSNLWPGYDITKPGPNVPPVGRSFQINTKLTISSTFDTISASIDRNLLEPAPPGIPSQQDLETLPENPTLKFSLSNIPVPRSAFQ